MTSRPNPLFARRQARPSIAAAARRTGVAGHGGEIGIRFHRTAPSVSPSPGGEGRSEGGRFGSPFGAGGDHPYLFSVATAGKRSAAFTPLPRDSFPATLRNFPCAAAVRTLKRPEGRAPVAIFRLGRARAFTVVELLVAVSVLTLIVLVLYGMFDQVQKALRGNVAQVDVLEGGRASMQLLSREMEQMQAANVTVGTNLYVGLSALPYHQALLDTNRVNALDEVFFLSHLNKSWYGTGYRVLLANSNGIATGIADRGVGTLCRYTVKSNDPDFPYATEPPHSNLLSQVMLQSLNGSNNLANYQPVLDGVLHFRIRAFDTNGVLMVSNIYPNVRIITNALFQGRPTGETVYSFTNSALPAYVEVEMAVLDPHILEKYRGFPNLTVASNYLARQAGAVHLFQQRIPVRTAK